MSINEPALLWGGKLTFWGAYCENRMQIIQQRHWGANTVSEYESALKNIICRHIPDHNRTSLASLTMRTIDATITSIAAQGYEKETGIISKYDPTTLERFRYLIRVVVEAAAENYYCYNIFDDQYRNGDPVRSLHTHEKIIPKSMTIEQEIRIGKTLLADPMQPGEYIALLSMFSWAARNNEACGIDWGDLRLWQDTPNCWVIWVYKTTEIGCNNQKSSGKTKNADRVVVLPSRYVELLLARKKRIQNILGPSIDVDTLPVACKGNNFYERCSADDVTAAAKRLFKRVGILPEQICQAYNEILRTIEEEKDPLCLLADPLEKEPTAYWLRRAAATSLALVGLQRRNIAYYVGHDLGENRETRNELLNTKTILDIKSRLDQRAIVNAKPWIRTATELNLDHASSINASGDHVYQLPAEAVRVHVHLAVCEPLDTVSFSLQSAHATVQVSCANYYLPIKEFPESLDIMVDYHNQYQSKLQER